MSAGPRPSTAPIWLSLLLPGLGHFRLGQRRRGIAALLSCALLFFAGYAIVSDRLFYYALLGFDRDGLAAAVTRYLPVFNLPESLALALAGLGTALGFEPGFAAERLWRLPRELEHLGSFLTGTGGILSAVWAADVAWLLRRGDAPATGSSPALQAGLSWLVPGLGHWRVGQRDKGVLVGAAVLVVFAAGLVASEGHAVDRGIQPVWWIGQCLFGGGALFAAVATAPLQFSSYPPGHDLGVVLCTVAGLMNLVVMVDAYTVAERRALGLPVLPPQEQEAAS